ncbi:hypothetical protein GGR88_002662 [Sphingomonas jejuensis]|uniref:YdbS-like PH domain-containing protein n=1 Tax=Sphingomonas jejuensis TaxID=904715 RepID=A0ABX0XP32_9SPHN|nr:PH domain-containing protein [Sphingomonas jejuensis]NJC35148.1 hypothetical protein [Sphingomonas jejuensis]
MSAAETLAGEALDPLDPRYRTVLRLGSLVAALPLLVAAVVADAVLSSRFDFAFGAIASGIALLLISWVLVSPARRFNAWGYRLDGDELNVARGVLTRTHSIVPLQRVQHIDVGQGAIARRFGLAELVVHTAGTHGAAVTIPGLALPEAERLRDEIRLHIRREAE